MTTAFERVLCICVLAMGMMVLAAASTGCSRTSDGSYVMRRPAMLSRVFGMRDGRSDVARIDAGPVLYTSPQPAAPSPQPESKLPTVSMPSMSIARNPPFKLDDPDKPLSCRNETTSTGRVRMVCM